MPNIFKSFWKSSDERSVDQYIFPQVEDIPVEADPEPEDDTAVTEYDGDDQTPEPEEDEEQANAASVISFAKVQADEIVAAARREAEAMLEQHRRDMEEEALRVRQEAHDDGYRQGYAEGVQQARLEGQQQMEQFLQEQAHQVQQFLEQAQEVREEMLQKTRDELLDLTVAIAEKVIHISLKSSLDVIGRMIQMATEKLRRREWVHIYVGGYSTRELSQITPELTMALSGISDHIKITPMPEDERGACIIEMPDAIIDASASTQLQNIREILGQS